MEPQMLQFEIKPDLKRENSIPAAELEKGFVESEKPRVRLQTQGLDKFLQSLAAQKSSGQSVARQTVETKLEKKISEVKESSSLSQAALAKINKIIQGYRITMKAPKLQPVEKQRNQVKERLIRCMLQAIEQLRQDTNRILNEKDSELLALNQKGMLEKARKISLVVETNLLCYFNKNLRDSLNKSYNDRFRIIYANLKDPQNLELRRKVLFEQITAKDLCVLKEIQLYSANKRKMIEEKQRLVMMQNTLSNTSVLRIKDGVIQYEDQMAKEPAVVESPVVIKKVQVQKQKIVENLKRELLSWIEQSEKRMQDRMREVLPEEQSRILVERLRKVSG